MKHMRCQVKYVDMTLTFFDIELPVWAGYSFSIFPLFDAYFLNIGFSCLTT